MVTIADTRLLNDLTTIAVDAAAVILDTARSQLGVRAKEDRSPVTIADEAAEALILERLDRLLPGVPVVSEEAAAKGVYPKLGNRFLLVDPLDGTKEFVSGLSEYTVNIAVVEDQMPVIGVVVAPALGLLWRGVVEQLAERCAFAPSGPKLKECTPIHVRAAPSNRLVVALSRSHLDSATAEFVARLPNAERVASGSSIKFCRIAEGAADVYPRLSPTSEWDVAAAHAVLAAAGGVVATPDGSPISYGSVAANFKIPGFIAWGDPTIARRFRV
jgi:3'(2'), 5'-bisphosphate nucleotidase